MRRPVLARALASLVGLVSAALLLAGVATPATAAAADPGYGTATAKFMTGWFPYWRGNTELDQLLANAGPDGIVGEVMPFWLYTRYRDGGMQSPVCVHDLSDDKVAECARTAPTSGQQAQLARMHAAGLKVYPSFTDDSSRRALSAVMADPVKRTALINAQVGFIVTNGFDGMDLDYEDFAFTDGQSSWVTTKPAWVAYITQLSAALHAQGKKLSVTVPTGEPTTNGDGSPTDSSTYWVYAWSEIIDSIDRLRLMTYDYSWSDAGPIGPATWIDRVAAAAVAQLGTRNAYKIWLGITAYGYDWRPASSCATARKTTLYPQQAWDLYQSKRAAGQLVSSARWDSAAAEFTFSYKETVGSCQSIREVWFQDSTTSGSSAVARAQIAAKYRLGGVAMWAIGDERARLWSDLNAAAPGIKPVQPVITMSAPSRVEYGRAARLAATVARSDGFTMGGVPVSLRWRAAGTSTWTVIGSTQADAEGAVSFTSVPTRNGEFQVTSPAALGRQAASSPIRSVQVAPKVTSGVRVVRGSTSVLVSTKSATGVAATVARGSKARVSGRATPAVGGVIVRLLAQGSGGKYSELSRTRTSLTGAYVLVLPTTTRGTRTLVVSVASTPFLAAGRSLPLTVTVR